MFAMSLQLGHSFPGGMMPLMIAILHVQKDLPKLLGGKLRANISLNSLHIPPSKFIYFPNLA